MGQPVALIGHYHMCPMTVPHTHVGGPVVTGQVPVRVNGIPVAVIGDNTVCVGVPCADKITGGSKIARINGRAIARLGDGTSHGGRLTQGFPGVRID